MAHKTLIILLITCFCEVHGAVDSRDTCQNDTETTVPGRPMSLRPRPFTDRISLSWTPPSDQIVLVRGYILGYGINIPDFYKLPLNSTLRHYTITNLQASSHYVISLRAYNNIGEGVPIFARVMTRAETTPVTPPATAPRDLTVTGGEEEPTWIILNWQPPRQPNGQIVGYLVFYTTEHRQPMKNWVVEGVLGEKLSTTIHDLMPDTTYYFKVQARNSKGYGPMSPTVIFRTPTTPVLPKQSQCYSCIYGRISGRDVGDKSCEKELNTSQSVICSGICGIVYYKQNEDFFLTRACLPNCLEYQDDTHSFQFQCCDGDLCNSAGLETFNI